MLSASTDRAHARRPLKRRSMGPTTDRLGAGSTVRCRRAAGRASSEAQLRQSAPGVDQSREGARCRFSLNGGAIVWQGDGYTDAAPIGAQLLLGELGQAFSDFDPQPYHDESGCQLPPPAQSYRSLTGDVQLVLVFRTTAVAWHRLTVLPGCPRAISSPAATGVSPKTARLPGSATKTLWPRWAALPDPLANRFASSPKSCPRRPLNKPRMSLR
jgi:hypothetical protein